ncbi:MAG: 50S ribosomal protein L29 [Hydrotalea sp.]|nr:50S ribosomal protein L29 [Hydrotalea sp.]
MAKEKTKRVDYRDKTAAELKTALLALRRAQFNLRFRKTQGNLEKPSEMRLNRRDIARIKTYMTMQNKKDTASKPTNNKTDKKKG